MKLIGFVRAVNQLTDSPMLAEGNMPMLPVNMEASSDIISPKILPVTMVSNCCRKREAVVRLKNKM